MLPDAEREHTPFNDHLFNVLRPVISPFVSSDTNYQRLFDTFEYFWCLMHVDAQIHTKARLEPWTPFGIFVGDSATTISGFRTRSPASSPPPIANGPHLPRVYSAEISSG